LIIFSVFTVKFRKDLQRKLELKLSPLLKSVAALPSEMQLVNYTHLHSYSENNMLNVSQVASVSYIFICLFIYSSWYSCHYDIIAIFCLLH